MLVQLECLPSSWFCLCCLQFGFGFGFVGFGFGFGCGHGVVLVLVFQVGVQSCFQVGVGLGNLVSFGIVQ